MKMKGYKGFNPDWTCRDKQYAIGETYEEETAKMCRSGIHFCEYPLDVLGYYPPVGTNMELNKFAVVEADDLSPEKADDTKRVCKKLKLQAELNFAGLAKAAVEYIREQAGSDNTKSASGHRSVASNAGDQSVASNTGDYSLASNTGNQSVASNTGYQSVASNAGDHSVASNAGDRSVASNTGYQSVASNTGHRSVASNTGYQSVASNAGNQSVSSNTGDWSVAKVEGAESIALSIGYKSAAAASLGSWIVLAEWGNKGGEYHIIDVKSARVDGEHIKPDTLYRLEKGEFVEA
ncbi:MAG: hypothetical protein SOR75_11320 [Synergistes jonesii]|uniref:DUF7666 domain-containing protein n=1 Tax=Synergistes jonesii TaxID=2754 RepID=UPI002A755BA4|nr:hypothetical protein [Synergistes jonesii]MDY2985899.1 hypothetical protein [Synergistes jonesii]